jgi:hypothetical protein
MQSFRALRLGQRRERLEHVVFDLPDPLAGDAEGAPHLVECSRLTAMQAEAELDNAALAFGQRGERVVDALASWRDPVRPERAPRFRTARNGRRR